MSSPWLAVRRTTTDVLTVVSATSSLIVAGVSSAEEMALLGHSHAKAFRSASEADLIDDEEDRRARRKQERLRSNAQFYKDLATDLSKDPLLASIYVKLAAGEAVTVI